MIGYPVSLRNCQNITVTLFIYPNPDATTTTTTTKWLASIIKAVITLTETHVNPCTSVINWGSKRSAAFTVSLLTLKISKMYHFLSHNEHIVSFCLLHI